MRHIISDPRGNPVYTSFGSWRSRNGNSESSSRGNVTYHNPRSILFLHVKASNWNSVIVRAKSHPTEILMIDDNGNTPLHIACQLDLPIEVLVSLKDAVTQTNSWGATPLHVAASHRCNVVALKKLIEYFPGALCRLSRMNRTPIHYACMSYRGLDLVAFQVLLEQTIKESHRLEEEQRQQRQHHASQGHADCDSKITDFIDILQEVKDDIKDDNILDDEEISVLIDNDSNHAIATYSSDPSSSVNAQQITSTQIEEEENNAFGPNKDNYNIVTWKDTSGKTPLGLLFRRYRERVKRVIEILEQMKNSTTNTTRSSSSLQTDLGHLWGKARLIVVLLAEEYRQQQCHESRHSIGKVPATERRDDESSASGEQWSQAASWSKERLSNRNLQEIEINHNFDDKKIIPTEEWQFRIVHASVGLAGYGCPPEMIRLAMSIYPHQVSEMDENGNLPLHIAATASSLGNLASINSVVDEESSVFSDSIVSLFSAISSKKDGERNCNFDSFDKVIKLLLKQYPQAAQTPHGRSGRLPFVLADRAGHRTWNDGMKTLLRAYPPALFSGSKGMIPVKLYPNVLSLIGGGNSPELSSRVFSGINNLPTMNTKSPYHRSCCNNRFKGRGGIGLLHNLMILKQRHMKELMAGSLGTSRQLSLPSYSKGNTRSQPQRKKRRELATTMFELLRAKPDLIEACRSHEPYLKTDFRQIRSYGATSTSNSTNNSCCLGKPDSNESQQLLRGRKRNTSRKLIEKMKVFERKSWKSL